MGALVLRSKFQRYLYDFGCFIERNPGSVLFVGLLALITFCLGLKSATIETNVEKLWVEVGGRLGKEIEYIEKTMGEGFGSTNQLIIQTPKNHKSNILHPSALLLHLEAIKIGTQVTVDMFEASWRLKDVCYSLSIPAFEEQLVDETLEKLIPCAIITPLDCFWEGSKLLGPEDGVKIPLTSQSLTWVNFNPQALLTMAKSADLTDQFGPTNRFPFETFDNLMKRAGISTAYQNKPCLNPKDSECPSMAPNKNGIIPDVGFELTGGCYGFATKWMHWPEELIVGGIKKNRTGHIVKATAFQSIIQLMAEQDMFAYWKNHYKVHNIDWTVEKARMVLEAWQRKFTKQVQKFVDDHNVVSEYVIDQFTSVALLDIMKNFSKINVSNILIGYILMLIYTALALSNTKNCVESQSFLGILGVLLVSLAIASGLGFCSLVGLAFNASTTQIIPFLALGLGVDTLFLLIHTYSENLKKENLSEMITAEVLQQIGYSILLNAFCICCAFGGAAIIPIPALRYFVAQSAILILFTTLSVLILFPSLEAIDLRRRKASRMDILCCVKVKNSNESDNFDIVNPNEKNLCNQFKNTRRQNEFKSVKFKMKLSPKEEKEQRFITRPFLNVSKSENIEDKLSSFSSSSSSSLSSLSFPPSPTLPLSPAPPSYVEEETKDRTESSNKQVDFSLMEKFTVNYFVNQIYIPLLKKKAIKVIVILICFIFLIMCLFGLSKVKDGLDLTEIVPRDSSSYRFLRNQKKFFSVYNMYAVTQGNFEYPNNQKLLHEYHSGFTRVSKIIKNDDGGLPDFWLTMFRDWLIGLQSAFDLDWKKGCINKERWYSNASADGILAYKLLVQTGRVDNPIDKNLVSKIRLVNENGTINPKAFYNYLTAWVSNDALAYSASQANFHPEPRSWIHVPSDVELKIPKSLPLVYTQIPFYLDNMDTTEEITETIKQVRAICENFESKGLPNFPTGTPFIYWEQYLRLRLFLLSSLAVVFAIIFLVVCIILFNPWAASLLVIVLAITNVELFGLMGLLDIRLSAVPAVILIISVGKGNNILIHLLLSFLTSVGKRNERMSMALKYMFAPLTHGEISTLLGVLMLAFSEFDFVIRYFFYVFCGVIALSSWNGLVLFPVLLSLFGPSTELVLYDLNYTTSPSPLPRVSREPRKVNFKRHSKNSRVQSEISLSTISEETPSYHSSHEIVVQPELVVETTTVTDLSPHKILKQTTSSNVTNDKNGSDSSDRDTPESIARSSPTCNSDSGSSSISRSSCNTSCNGFGQQTVTTKVTTTAKVKVEVHTPFHDRDHMNTNRNKNQYQNKRGYR